MAKFSCLNPHVSSFFTIFHRLHHHVPDENPYRCSFHLRAHAEGLTRGCRLGCATSGENCGIFQWRLRWFAKHLAFTSFFKMWNQGFSMFDMVWPWKIWGITELTMKHLVKKIGGLTIKFGWNKCGYPCGEFTEKIYMQLAIYASMHLSIYLFIYLSIYLSTYLSTVSIPAYSWHFYWTRKWSRRWRNTLLLKFLF